MGWHESEAGLRGAIRALETRVAELERRACVAEDAVRELNELLEAAACRAALNEEEDRHG